MFVDIKINGPVYVYLYANSLGFRLKADTKAEFLYMHSLARQFWKPLQKGNQFDAREKHEKRFSQHEK